MLLELILSSFSLSIKSKVQLLPSIRTVPYVTGYVDVPGICEMHLPSVHMNKNENAQQLHRNRV